MKKETLQRAMLWTLLIAYILLMVWLMFLRRTQWVEASYSLIPFRTIREFWGLMQGRQSLVRIAIINLAGNIVMFIPPGILLPALWKKQRTYWRFLLTVAAVIVMVELLQYFTRLGACDIDDLILNLLGASIGFWLFRLVTMMQKTKDHAFL